MFEKIVYRDENIISADYDQLVEKELLIYNEKVNNGKATDLPEAIIINSVSGTAGIVTAYNLNYNTTAGTTTQNIWTIATNDMSGCTGITAFDFDGNELSYLISLKSS